ncbi:hypothetical protein ASD19_00735 [Microbacterium sp. Root53]|nr:hypothetical protein ASD19_00735 [Microbacterium sp. Root53]
MRARAGSAAQSRTAYASPSTEDVGLEQVVDADGRHRRERVRELQLLGDQLEARRELGVLLGLPVLQVEAQPHDVRERRAGRGETAARVAERVGELPPRGPRSRSGS